MNRLNTIRNILTKLRNIIGQLEFQRVIAILSYYIKGLIRRIGMHHVFLMGAGLAFSLFTCLVPLILILFSVLGIILEIPEIEQQANNFIDTLVPYQESAKLVKDVLYSRIVEFKLFKTLAVMCIALQRTRPSFIPLSSMHC